MKSQYVPDQDLSLDESMVLWRGQLLFCHYIKNKRHEYQIKFNKLYESNGIVLRVGTPNTDPLLLGQTAAIILYLLKDLLCKDYAVRRLWRLLLQLSFTYEPTIYLKNLNSLG